MASGAMPPEQRKSSAAVSTHRYSLDNPVLLRGTGFFLDAGQGGQALSALLF
jgi:hypothetical protein